jgi:hypothetical protein
MAVAATWMLGLAKLRGGRAKKQGRDVGWVLGRKEARDGNIPLARDGNIPLAPDKGKAERSKRGRKGRRERKRCKKNIKIK